SVFASETRIQSPSRTLLAFNSPFSFNASRSIVLGCRPKPIHHLLFVIFNEPRDVISCFRLMPHRCASLEYHLAIAISAALFCVRPPFCDYPEHWAEGWFYVGDDSDPDTSR